MTVGLDLAGRVYWYNTTLTPNDKTLMLDLREFAKSMSHMFKAEGNGDDGVPMWTSDNYIMSTVPAMFIAAWRQDPRTATDFLSQSSNLLYSDLFYVKMDFDRGYIQCYNDILRSQEEAAEQLRPYMLLLGASMFAVGALTVNPALAYWGADMICQTVTGSSLVDHIARPLLRLAGMSENFVGNFSFWHITSDRGLDLFLQEAVAEVMSGGINMVGRGLLVRAGSSRVASVVNAIGHSGVLRYVGRGLAYELGEVLEATAMSGLRKAGRILWLLTKEYFELVFEVMFEMGFDNMLSMKPGGQPLGGGATFLTLMSVYTLTRAALDGRMEPTLPKEISSTRLKIGRIGTMLFIAQMACLVPVLQANLSSDVLPWG